MKFKNMIATAALATLVLPQMVLADANIAVDTAGTPAEATAHVVLRVTVPEILIFGVGALGDNIAVIDWGWAPPTIGGATGSNLTYAGPAVPPFAAPAPFATPTVTGITNGGTGAGGNTTATATLPVYLFSNNGSDVTITANIAGGAGGGGTAGALDAASGNATIPISDFTSGVGAGTTITHPALLIGGDSADTPHSGGIVNQAGTWTYMYTPALTTPVAGFYQGRVTYVAAQP